MDHREKSENLGGPQAAIPPQQRVPIRPRPVAPQTPHRHCEPLEILARMPNLEVEPPTKPTARRHRRNRQEEGRLLSSRTAVPLLALAGVLLLAVAVVPSLLTKKDTVGTTAGAGEEPPAWQSQGPDAWSTPFRGSPDAPAVPAEPGHDHKVAAFSGESGGLCVSMAPSTAAASAAARPHTVQVQASSRQQPVSGIVGPLDAEISSWRDAGQWPYGNGVGLPVTPRPGPGEYSKTADQTASFGLPPGVQGTPIPYVSLPGSPELPQAGMNRSMALGGPASIPAAAYPEQNPSTTATPAGGLYGSAAAYSADARSAGWPQSAASYPNFPSMDSAGSYPPAAASSPAYDGGRYQTVAPTVGTPIPGTTGAAGEAAGGWAAPQGASAARLQGVIEKPSARTTYEYNRPSIY